MTHPPTQYDPERHDPERHPFEILADEFTERCRRGEHPTVEEYALRHPEHADQINRLFPSIMMIEQLGQVEHTDRRSAQTDAHRSHRTVERLGDYRIIQEIGRGGMGIVYEAVQESLGRRVAIKVLARQALLDQKHLRRFDREARTAAALHHTNIVPVFGVGAQNGYHYYVMQLIRGIGLDEVIAEFNRIGFDKGETKGTRSQDALDKGRASHVNSVVRSLHGGTYFRPRKPDLAEDDEQLMDLGRAPRGSATHTELANTKADLINAKDTSVDGNTEAAPEAKQTTPEEPLRELGDDYWHSVATIGLQVSDALYYAHSQGTLHRDIKPANLLLDTEGIVWIADFGLAKALEQDDVSLTGDVVGTLRYMAPEQFLGHADHRSDIFSLGLTLYELLTLKPARDDSSRTHRMIGSGNDPGIERPKRIHPELPSDLETIVLKACAHHPTDRYQSAQELAADLHCFLEDRPIQARRSNVFERFIRWSRRNPAVASLSATAILLLVAVALVTSVGYIQSSRALQRESEQRERAETEKQKAEKTLEISLDALDNIYRRFAPDRMVVPRSLTIDVNDGESIPVPSQLVLSRETASLLEDILEFYDRFAQQDSDNIRLREEAARANRRVGDIQQRLGAYEKARNAYFRAIDSYEKLSSDAEGNTEYQIELARIHNELGSVYAAWQKEEDAANSFDKAIEILQSRATHATATSDVKFELARTYYLLGKRKHPEPGAGPPGAGPPGHRDPPGLGPPGHWPPGPRSVEWGPSSARPDDPERARDADAEGRDRRFEAPPSGRPPLGPPPFGPPGDAPPRDGPPHAGPPHAGPPHAGPPRPGPPRAGQSGGAGQPHRPYGPEMPPQLGTHQLDLAIELLTDLANEYSAHPEYRYLLALCYRDRAHGPQSDDSDAAIHLLERLNQQHPTVADYQYELSETYAMTDVRVLAMWQLDDAEQRLRRALAYAESLCAEHPNIPEYAHGHAHTNLKLGTVLLRNAPRLPGPDRNHHLDEAVEHFRTAVRIQEQLAKQFSNVTSYQIWLAKMYESLAEGLDDSNHPEDARTSVERSIAILEQTHKENPELEFINRSLAQNHDTLADILDRQDDHNGAKAARRRADELYAPPFDGPRRPARSRRPPIEPSGDDHSSDESGGDKNDAREGSVGAPAQSSQPVQ